MAVDLTQLRPGEWHLVSTHIPEPVPVPSWLVEAHIKNDDLPDLARALGRVYGCGRAVGREEGITYLQQDLKSLLGLDHV
nr:MAG TPA: hypothetical protein [Caudoviricetes sp.]